LVGMVLLPLFWRIEKRAADPIIRPSFFDARQIRFVMMIAAGLGSIECAQVFFPALGVAGLGVSASTAAWLMLPGVFVMMLVSPLAGKVVDKIGPTRVIQGSLMVVLVGLLVYSLADITYVTFIGGGMIVGVGVAALLGAPLRYIVLEEARAEDRAATQGLLNIFLAVGQLSGAAIVGAVATSAGGGTEGYQAAFAVLAAITVVIGIIGLRMKYMPPASAKSAPETTEPVSS
jgi:MFS family permease